MNVKSIISELEKDIELPKGNEERFSGFGIMGLTFRSGHVLVLKRSMVSSIGGGFISVWHRDPTGEWTFYLNTDPSRSCTRYFGEAAREAVTATINFYWTGKNQFRIEIKTIGLQWDVVLRESVGTRLINAISRITPEHWWKNSRILKFIGFALSKILNSGKMGLSGHVPNGQYFVTSPYKIWLIKKTRATLNNIYLGDPGPLSKQAQLEDFKIPQRGLFALDHSYFERFDANKHSARTSKPRSSRIVGNEPKRKTA